MNERHGKCPAEVDEPKTEEEEPFPAREHIGKVKMRRTKEMQAGHVWREGCSHAP